MAPGPCSQRRDTRPGGLRADGMARPAPRLVPVAGDGHTRVGKKLLAIYLDLPLFAIYRDLTVTIYRKRRNHGRELVERHRPPNHRRRRHLVAEARHCPRPL